MEILFGLVGLLFLLSILAGFVFFAIFIARKMGIIKVRKVTNTDGETSEAVGITSYLTDLKQLNNTLLFRFIVIGILIGLMTMPLGMISKLVRERSQLYHQVLNDIAGTWGHQQQLKGPALFVPYTEKFTHEVTKTDKDGNERKETKVTFQQRTAIVLPDDLKIEVYLEGQTRKRSLYESLVYTADIKISGQFKRPDIQSLSADIDKIHWDKAWLALGISDTQAINNVSALSWNNTNTASFDPGTKAIKLLENGFHASLDLSQDDTNDSPVTYPFSLTINANGSQGFYFVPFGKTTNVSIASDWPHPSYQGNKLPDTHQEDAKGFKAQWSVPHLARNYPQLWTTESQEFNVDEFKAGVNLFETVSLYSQITRAIKYGVLFFVLTFITFLIFELGIGRRLHIVQYGVIGLALSMFYLALLSLAEHLGFFNAYLSASAVIIVLISLYAFAAIRSLGRTSIIAVLLTGLYALLYSLLKLEDYALLAGTVLLLVILAVMMYLTRNIGRVKS